MRSIVPILADAAGQLVELAAEAGGEHAEKSGASLILPEIGELIWGAVTFLVLLALLWWKAFPAIGRLLDERSAKIQGDLEEAESKRQEAEAVLDEYKAKLADARSESNRIIEEARKTAEELRKELIEKAHAEASSIVDRARQEVEAEKRQALSDLYREAGKVSIDLAEKVVGKSIDREMQTSLIDQYIRELESMPGRSN